MLEFYTEPNVEQAFKTLIENFSNSLLNDKRLEANDLLVNQQFNHNNNFRKNWGKDELIFFAKILYFYVTEKKVF